jgi:DNA-binding LacI/PurR family transcriptional regulator/DNA-binding transcriptional regulator YhcF (GntR family)
LRQVFAEKKAVKYIETAVTRKAFKQGEWLPSIRAMASEAGVSSFAMWRAVGSLRGRYNFEILKKRGIFFAGTGAPAASVLENTGGRADGAVSRAGPKWQYVKKQIARDILNGVFRPAVPLPSCKELCARYGTSHGILKYALHSLVSDSSIARVKRGFQPQSPSRSAARSRILLLTSIDFYGNMFVPDPRGTTFVRSIERECFNRGIWFDLKGYVDNGNAVLTILEKEKIKEAAANQSQYIGFLVLKLAPDASGLVRLVEQLSPLDKPIAVLEDQEATPLPSVRNRSIVTFQLAYTPSCGKAAARYLLSMGHRSVAFISAYHRNDWSRSRLEGMLEVYDEAGIADGVAACTNDSYTGFWDIYHRPDKFRSLELDKLASVHSELALLEKDPAPHISVIAAGADHFLKTQETHAEERYIFNELFSAALGRETTTAWVCANDTMAVAALDFLKNVLRKVPQDISVFGFDDIYEAFSRNLTSYNFNLEQAAFRMLNFVLNPGHYRALDPSEKVEIDGMVIERLSVGRPLPAR